MSSPGKVLLGSKAFNSHNRDIGMSLSHTPTQHGCPLGLSGSLVLLETSGFCEGRNEAFFVRQLPSVPYAFYWSSTKEGAFSFFVNAIIF